jgi:hypothetical protein
MRGKIRSTLISRKLRANQTDAETKLWNRVRNRQINGKSLSGKSRSAATFATSFAAKDSLLSKSMADNIQSQPATKRVIAICVRGVIA